jgi:PAS domain S-box-containing protein
MNAQVLIYASIIVSATVLFSSLLISLYRKTLYLRLFTFAFVSYLVSYTLLSFQTMNNLWLTSVISNTFLVGGYLLLIASFRLFYDSAKVWPKRFWIYLFLATIISYFTAIYYYDVILRNIVLGPLTVIIFIDFGFFIFTKTKEMSPVIMGTIVISLVINTLSNFLRPIIAIYSLTPQNLPIDGLVLNVFVFSSYAITSIFWLTSIILADSAKLNRQTLINEDKYRSLVESIDDVIAVVNKVGDIIYINEIASKYIGVTSDQLIKMNVIDIFKSYQSQVMSAIDHVFSTQKGFNNDMTLVINHQTYHFKTSFQPLKDENDLIYAVLISATDITELKKSKDLVKQSEENYKTMFFDAIEGKVLIKDGIIIECNKAAAKMLGYEIWTLIGKSHLEISPQYQSDGQDSTTLAKELTSQALNHGHASFEWTHIKLDGDIILVLVSLSLIHYSNQQVLLATWQDITAQKIAQEEANKFKTIADQATYGNGIVSMDGNLIYSNEAFSKMHGYETDEIMGLNLMSLHSEIHHDRVIELVDLIKTKGGFALEEVWRIRKDGTLFPSLMSASIVVNDKNVPQFMAATVLDITDIKHKENEIRKLTIAIEQSPFAVVITDLKGYIQYVSPAFEVITGYKSEEVIGKHTRILSSGTTSREVYKSLWRTILSGQVWSGEWINKKKNGELFHEAISITPVKDEMGQISYFLAVKENITQRKNVEEALIKSEQQFRLLFSESPVAILIHDKDTGDIIDSNPETLRMLGLTDQHEIVDFIEQHDTENFFSQYIEIVKKVAYKGISQYEGQFKKQNGGLIWVSVNFSILEIWNQTRILAIAMDVTKQKQAEQDKLARQIAEEASRVKSIFFSNMSHEIRTPLNAINGFAQILRRDSTLSDKQSEYVKTILRSGEHLIGLINDILDISKIEAGRLTLSEYDFSFQDLITDLKMMFAISAREKNLYFEFDVQDKLPSNVISDESKLRQVFINLIFNALKFTHNGGITVRIRVGQEIKEFLPLFVEVIDTGQGIADSDLPFLFDPFWQSETGQIVGGTGLGLPICKNIMDLMGGSISVESKVGFGTTIKFEILIKLSEKTQIKTQTPKAKVVSLSPNIGPFRVLIADDREDNRVVLRELLKPLGFEIIEVENGLDAVKAFESWKPHAIMMDMRMSIMDGYEAIQTIRSMKEGKSVFIIGITASVFSEDLDKIKEAGADEVMNKPFNANELLDLLTKIPGVSYIYEHETTIEISDFDSLQQTLLNISFDIVQEMKKAIESGNMVLLRQHASSIEGINKTLAKEIINMSRNYDYESLYALFQIKEV